LIRPTNHQVFHNSVFPSPLSLPATQVQMPSSVASTKQTTLVGLISDVVRSGRGPDFVA